ncbi:alpha/beta hydrolase [Confluentibacter flavum]|uniref:XynC protein n=1 Tax=Confluentibacter flavum TaxID=1909700 RepID=A0A2N3HIG3_9FLAO|nr:alpha/beta hydrolase family protein [Confluentibacter flavum]PKQ44765.1 XynC protein [Confluentibacter flavum]
MIKLKTTLLLLTIHVFFINVATSQVDTLMVFSKSMNKNIPNMVITPDNYASNNQRLPVLYLLHGAGGNFKDWISKAPLVKQYANDFNIMIVCPDGGVTSWYFDSPIDDQMKYETYVSNELIEGVDKNYKTIPNKNGRAITGLSMGGHGALYLAFKHQDVWGATGSMSGGVDIRPFPNNWDIKKRLGTYPENKENWEKNSVINLVYLLDADLKIIIDCGYDDFFFDDNKRLHDKLVERNIAHDYIERPGTHNWNYWTNAIKYQLVFFNDTFKR